MAQQVGPRPLLQCYEQVQDFAFNRHDEEMQPAQDAETSSTASASGDVEIQPAQDAETSSTASASASEHNSPQKQGNPADKISPKKDVLKMQFYNKLTPAPAKNPDANGRTDDFRKAALMLDITERTIQECRNANQDAFNKGVNQLAEGNAGKATNYAQRANEYAIQAKNAEQARLMARSVFSRAAKNDAISNS